MSVVDPKELIERLRAEREKGNKRVSGEVNTPAPIRPSVPPVQTAQPAPAVKSDMQPTLHTKPQATKRATVLSDAPLSRSLIDDSVKPLRILGGVILIGYSMVSTIAGVHTDLSVLRGIVGEDRMSVGGIPITLIVGLVVAIALQILQVVLAEKHPWGYATSLALDGWYTFKLTYPWVMVLSLSAAQTVPLAVEVIAWGVSAAVVWLLASELLRADNEFAPWVGVAVGVAYVVLVLATNTGNGSLTDPNWRYGSRIMAPTALIVSMSIAIAYFGEVMIFGRRRRTKG